MFEKYCFIKNNVFLKNDSMKSFKVQSFEGIVFINVKGLKSSVEIMLWILKNIFSWFKDWEQIGF